MLNAISRLPHAQGPLFDLGVPEKSMVIMKQYQRTEESAGDAAVFTEACETFAYIADHPPNQPFLSGETMVKYIIATMDENLHLSRVQAGCARALSNLAAHNHNTTHLLHMGGVELVVRELEMFPDDDNVQINSMRTLRSLAVGRENLDYLLQKGAAGLAVHAMQTHMHEPELLRIGAGTLHDMATLTRHRRLIARSGALECLVAAVQKYPTDRGIVQNSLACFWNLCIGVQETAIHLFSEGVVQMAVAEMRLFPNDVGVLGSLCCFVWAGCSALSLFCRSLCCFVLAGCSADAAPSPLLVVAQSPCAAPIPLSAWVQLPCFSQGRAVSDWPSRLVISGLVWFGLVWYPGVP